MCSDEICTVGGEQIPYFRTPEFYQVDGEGIRYELVNLVSAIKSGKSDLHIDKSITECISKIFAVVKEDRNGSED